MYGQFKAPATELSLSTGGCSRLERCAVWSTLTYHRYFPSRIKQVIVTSLRVPTKVSVPFEAQRLSTMGHLPWPPGFNKERDGQTDMDSPIKVLFACSVARTSLKNWKIKRLILKLEYSPPVWFTVLRPERFPRTSAPSGGCWNFNRTSSHATATEEIKVCRLTSHQKLCGQSGVS